jgi:hypothetical protein
MQRVQGRARGEAPQGVTPATLDIPGVQQRAGVAFLSSMSPGRVTRLYREVRELGDVNVNLHCYDKDTARDWAYDPDGGMVSEGKNGTLRVTVQSRVAHQGFG